MNHRSLENQQRITNQDMVGNLLGEMHHGIKENRVRSNESLNSRNPFSENESKIARKPAESNVSNLWRKPTENNESKQ